MKNNNFSIAIFEQHERRGTQSSSRQMFVSVFVNQATDKIIQTDMFVRSFSETFWGHLWMNASKHLLNREERSFDSMFPKNIV